MYFQLSRRKIVGFSSATVFQPAPVTSRSIQSVHHLLTLDWDSVNTVLRSAEGSVGVVFIEFDESQVVLKLPDKSAVAKETFGMLLAEKLGLHTPAFLVRNPDEESYELVIKKILDKTDASDTDLRETLTYKLSKKGNWSLILMDRLYGTTLTDMTTQKKKEVFGPEEEGGNRTQSFYEMGRQFALDVLIGNNDRFRAAFCSEMVLPWSGNSGNFLIGDNHWTIDTTLGSFWDESDASQYAKSVKKLVRDFQANDREACRKKIFAGLEKQLQFTLGPEAEEAFRAGFLEMAEAIRSEVNPALFRTLAEAVKPISDISEDADMFANVVLPAFKELSAM